MLSLRVEQLFREAIQEAYPTLDLGAFSFTLTAPTHRAQGDFSTPIALQLTKHLGQKPLEIAEAIAKKLSCDTILSKVETASPGFVNVWVDAQYLTSAITEFVLTPPPKKEETLLLEYSSPNIAKQMHIGHLRNTIYGEAMKRILRFLGYHVIADNHLGDLGTQFGKLIVAIRKFGEEEEIVQDPLNKLTELYVLFHERAEEDASLEDMAREESRKLEEGDAENTALWKWICEISLKDFEKTYALLGVEFDTMLGESFFAPMLEDIMALLVKEKIAKENEDGSLGIVFEDHGINLPSMPVRRRDGGTLYITRDIATIAYRRQHYRPARMIYVVGPEQELHFRQLFAIASLLEWDDVRYEHMSYGSFTLKEGKMSTRKGTVILAKDVIAEGRERVRTLLTERQVDAEIFTEELVDAIALSAIKYSDLSQNRTTPQVFDWEKVLSFEGNSAPYLQYTYARARSILRTSGVAEEALGSLDSAYVFETEDERLLALELMKFYDAVQKAGELLQPNILSQYLYDLASLFNHFYNTVPVLKDAEEKVKIRLRLVHVLSIVLKQGFDLLSLTAVERM